MKAVLGVALVAALLTVGCSSDDSDEAVSTSTTAGTSAPSDDTTPSGEGDASETFEVTGDTTVEVEVGGTFTLSLEANETTGYRWSEQVDGDAVRSTGGEYVAPDGGMVGQGGTQLLRYEAVEAGTATISLTYSQVGSGDIGEQYTVTVDVS